jgi:hypothetical protein
MELSGWIMMISSWAVIFGLTAFSLWRTLRVPPSGLTTPMDIESDIEDDEREKE